MATTVSQYGMTLTWVEDCVVGQYANGDYYIVAPSGITITEILPASVVVPVRNNDGGGTVSNSTINGCMVNPGSSQSATLAFDSEMAGWLASANKARPGGNDLSALNPLIVATNSSIVTSISDPIANSRPAITDAAVFTVVDAAPASGSFRPPVCGTDKTHAWNVSDLDYSFLSTAPAPTGTPSLATVASYFVRPWLEINTEQNGRYAHALNNQPEYGADMTNLLGQGLLSLHLGYSNAQKETLMIRLCQYGLDVYGSARVGGKWSANGGLNCGRKAPLILAGLAFNDSNILAYADWELNEKFQEDFQAFVVDTAQLSVVPYTGDSRERLPYKQSVVTFSGSDVNWTANAFQALQPMRFTSTGTLPSPLVANTDYIIKSVTTNTFKVCTVAGGAAITFTGGSGTHTATMIGIPEWGEKHSSQKNRDGSNWGVYYRDVNFRVVCSHVLFAIMATGGEAAWNNQIVVDYYDRVRKVNGSSGISTFFNNMWVLYRNNGGVGFPNAPTSLVATVTSNWKVSLTWVDNADNETHQLLERNSNGGAYSTVAEIDAGFTFYEDTTAIAGKTHAYRLSAVNATGASSYATATAVMPAAAPNYLSRQNVLISSTT